MKNRVAPRAAAVPGGSRLRSLFIVMCSLIIAGAIAYALAHDAIERIMVERALSSAMGGSATVAALHHHDEDTVLEGVHLATPEGGVTVDVDSLAYHAAGDTLDLRPSGTRVQAVATALRSADLDRVDGLVHALGGQAIRLRLTGADVTLARDTNATAPAVVHNLTGTLERSGSDVSYDLAGDLATADGAAHLTGHATSLGGRANQVWRAPRVPLAAIGELLSSDRLHVTTGVASDVVVRFDPQLHAHALLSDVGATLDTHAIIGLGGPIVVTPTGVGTPGLHGNFDTAAVPLDVVGEVDDGYGGRDTRQLLDMVTMIATQPGLRSLRVETLARGITFGQYAIITKATPHVVTLEHIDPREPTVHFDTAIAEDHVISHGERTSDLGVRTKAVAGVNGDYFDIGRTYEPQGLLVRSGKLVRGPADRAALLIDSHGKVTFDLFHFHGEVISDARRYTLTELNTWPARLATFITPDYGGAVKAAPDVTLATLEPLGGTRYRVTAVSPVAAPTTVAYGIGFGRETTAPLPTIGTVLDVRYTLDPYVPGVVAGIGGGPILVKDGEYYEDAHAPAPDERDVPWPVIAMGTLADDTVLLAAVDGRHPERSIGMGRPEFADVLRSLGVRNAMALDSGGSVTMIGRAPGDTAVSVRNVPSDNSAERYISDALLVYSSAPLGTIVSQARKALPSPSPSPTPMPAQ